MSFPDWPGVVTADETIDEAMRQAADVLTFAAEDWESPDGSKGIPYPRSIDELRTDSGMGGARGEAADGFRRRAIHPLLCPSRGAGPRTQRTD